MRVKPRIYVRIRVGHQLKFGNSTRNYILHGPSDDQEEPSAETITELMDQKRQKIAEVHQKLFEEKLEKEKKEKEEEDAGVSWGMQEDAEDEEPSAINPFAVTNNEELFLDDPKKTLRGFFEREGLDLAYRCDELSPGVFICRVDLPVVDEFGKGVTCEIQHKGKKKECVAQCALEACRILDRHGLLRQANQESKRIKRPVNSDDSDDDNFFDRTGDVEKKRQKKQGSSKVDPMTYEQLMKQEKEISENIQSSEKKLESMVAIEKRRSAQTDDDLDEFMENLSNLDDKVDKFTISTIKTEIAQMKTELQKIQKLVNIARPSIQLPPMKGKLPLFGKRSSLGRNFGVKSSTEVKVETVSVGFEVEEDGEEEIQKRNEVTDSKIEESERKTEGKSTEDKKKSEKGENKVSETNKEGSSQSKIIPMEVQECEKVDKSDKTHQKISEISNQTGSQKSPSKTSNSIKAPSPPPASEESLQETSKKRKNRIRIRGNRLRENIDMNDDDEYIDIAKVSTWVAPQDQTGDGNTRLNEKYGY